jgi:hypothetical protein
MTQLLTTIFGELGIAQYLDAFLEQGFDSWETILDITESDLYVGATFAKIIVCCLLGMLTRWTWTAMRWA